MINSELAWLDEKSASIDIASAEAAYAHQQQLTKPPGALGRLEDIAIQFAGWQGKTLPELNKLTVRVFAGDHGMCCNHISAFPQSVTAQMIDNFVSGGAAINVLCNYIKADFDILNLGTAYPATLLSFDKNLDLGPGTADALTQEAMSEAQLTLALNAGRQVVDLLPQDTQLFIGGEMGIGNTSAASLLFALLFDLPVAQLTGPGTGLDAAGISRKKTVLEKIQNRHQGKIRSSNIPALDVLKCCGGFEIAALCGAYVRAAQRGIPVLVDGFISSSAFLVAQTLKPGLRDWSLFSHHSAESGHRLVIEKLDVQPLLSLGMRLGEGSGAVVAVPIIQQALLLHRQMATFTGAGVDEQI